MTKPPSPRPLSIKVIALGHLAVFLFIAAYMYSPHYTSETPMVDIFLMSICAFLAVGLWALREVARWVAIGLAIFLLLFPFKESLEIIQHPPYDIPRGTWVPQLLKWCFLASILFGAEIWFLIKRKAAFGKPRTPP